MTQEYELKVPTEKLRDGLQDWPHLDTGERIAAVVVKQTKRNPFNHHDRPTPQRIYSQTFDTNLDLPTVLQELHEKYHENNPENLEYLLYLLIQH